MNNNRYLILCLIAVIALLIYSFNSCNESPPKQQIKKDITISEGIPTSEFRPGKPVIKENWVEKKGLKKIRNISTKGDTATNGISFPAEGEIEDSSFIMNYKFTNDSLEYSIKIKEVERITADTLIIRQVDTLKITETITNESPPEIYERPEVVITAGIVIGYLIKSFIK